MKTNYWKVGAALLFACGVAHGATFNLFTPANGVLKGSSTTYVTTAAAASDIYGLWTGTCDSTTFLRGDGSCASAGSGTAANPSGTVGTSAVNGVATTYMRSDAAPAINLAMSPTWTGNHTWNNANPKTGWRESDQGTDLKLWDWLVQGAVLSLRTRNDADNAGQDVMVVTRGATTAISSIALSNASSNAPVNVAGTGGVVLTTAGGGLRVKEGTNAKMGTCTLTAGACTVATTAVTATSRIFLTSQTDGGTPGYLRVSNRTASTSFVITSGSGADTSTVAWILVEPAP